MPKNTIKRPIKVDSFRYKDKRTNIPTEELRDFVMLDENTPQTMLYSRDPSLDPQLVWKGKDDQDREELAVPVLPIYIQEKIHPQALIDALPRAQREGDTLDLFADFNGGPHDFDQKIEFYQHEQNWTNRLILGDSLLVMASLSEKEQLKGKVQTIYMDPPYGIKFGSNWQVSTRKRDVKDGSAQDATREPEQIRAFRDTWKLGIHSYLSYLRDRLVVARDLLTETGSIFVQIGDENVHLIRSVMDEVLGRENFISQIAFVKTSGLAQSFLPSRFDFILWYGKNREKTKFRRVYKEKSGEAGSAGTYTWIELPDGSRRGMTAREKADHSLLPQGSRIYKPDNITSQGNPAVAFEYQGKQYVQQWKTNPEGLQRLAWAGRLHVARNTLQYIRYLDDFPYIPVTQLWADTGTGSFTEDKVYVVQTGTKVIERCLLMTTAPGDLVLDPTCGSGTTAYVAEQWGRRWITIDTSRVALALARTRLMSAKYPYYLLSDSLEGIKREAETSGTIPQSTAGDGDIRKGFVYKRVPHVTLKSIANNPDIRDGMTREEIDKATARHADSETLYDQPYEDTKRLRVCGPFSVESLSPHRVLSTNTDEPLLPTFETTSRRRQDFATMILENLRTAGVQNTRKSERIKFVRLDPHPGRWMQATGEYEDADGELRRVAVSIGPEHGTVGPEQVKDAAKEAVQGLGYDLLIVCGFAFDPHVGEEVKRYGTLTVLPTKMNPDLAMGDELLKKTGAGNLFMVFGEPDVDIRRDNDQIMVEIKGVDVYDPTTGQIRSGSTDDIACWFIDTDYNGESFFVRHAYFTGANKPYENLQRALKADIDEDVWNSLYRTTSRSFQKPRSGQIAIKVINHYGDEVLKVYSVK